MNSDLNKEVSNEDIAIRVNKLNKRRESGRLGLKNGMIYTKII